MTQQPTRLCCPNCGRFLGDADGRLDAPPCSCGWQTTRDANGHVVSRYVRKQQPKFMAKVEVKA